MSQRDYYALLGVPRDATPEEIKRAHRRLALRWHPDKNPGNKQAEERFKEIGEAYRVLSDARRRAEYDRAARQARQGPRVPQTSSPAWVDPTLPRMLAALVEWIENHPGLATGIGVALMLLASGGDGRSRRRR
jgi:curved DNA-binding protein CbpA